MEQQVLGRIAADSQFGKDDQVGQHFFTGPRCAVEHLARVPGHVADQKIKLCQRDGDFVSHCGIAIFPDCGDAYGAAYVRNSSV